MARNQFGHDQCKERQHENIEQYEEGKTASSQRTNVFQPCHNTVQQLSRHLGQIRTKQFNWLKLFIIFVVLVVVVVVKMSESQTKAGNQRKFAEQVLFSCLGAKVTVYSRKLQCFF